MEEGEVEMLEMKEEREALGGKHHNHLTLLVAVAVEIMVSPNNCALAVAEMGRVVV